MADIAPFEVRAGNSDGQSNRLVAALDAPAGTYNVVDDHPRTRRQLDAVLGARLRSPTALLRFGGDSAELLLTSCRASNQRFKDATGWVPRDDAVRTLPAGERTSLLATLGVLVLGVSALFLGVYATFWPRSFYADFPNGRGWVAADGPYNEHLVRDFGGLNLGLAVVAAIAVVVGGRWLLRAAAGSSLAFGLPHLAYHLGHLEHYATADKVGNVVSLGGSVVLALAVLATTAGRPAGRGG